MDREYAQYLLKKTQEDYNLIAEDYARTRPFFLEDVISLGKYTLVGEKVLDSGCANGILLDVLKDKKIDYFGVDISGKLIEIAKKKYPEAKFQVTDALNLSLPDSSFDKVYSISVLHNIPSQDFQLQYLKEIARILKPKGLLIMRVWDFWKRRDGWKLFLKYTFLKMIGKSKLDFKDVFVPWKNSKGQILIQRYFHCFTKRELENLIKEVGLKIKESWRAGKDPRTNIYLIAEK
jgi:ubiquinone/menaquinone biosynthesis C-methylase UbiE